MTALPAQTTAMASAGAGSATPEHGLSGPDLAGPDFERIAAIAYRAAGLSIGPGKSAMVRTRLARRLRALGLPSFEAYVAYLDGPDAEAEIGMLVSALTTNVSHFFRENHHFDILRSEVLPALVARARDGKRVRIWSAGCANGQEPYSIMMTLIDAGMPLDRDVRLLATDIDPNVVRHARDGIYPASMLSGLPERQRGQYFEAVPGGKEASWKAGALLRRAIHFRVLNLLDPWPMHGRFDVIFCRNVVIYFDAATQDRLWHRFASQLTPDGWLFIGHSERLSSGVQAQFRGRGVTAYQHVDRSADGTSVTGTPKRGY